MNNQEINRVNSMSFRELRNELANCGNNKMKENIIRHIMYIRYQKHIERKMLIEQQKQKHIRTQMNKQKQNDENMKMKAVQELKTDDTDDNISLNSNDFESNSKFKSENELDECDPRDIQEYDRDLTNNNIIERLNSDIDIRTERNKKIEYKLIPPYSHDTGNNYAPFETAFKPTRTNFSNIKIKKKN